MKRRLASALAVAALTISCSGGDGGGTTSDEPAGDTMVIAEHADIGQLLSPVYETSSDSAILQNIHYPLVDSEFDCSLKKLPGIVTDWQWSEDGKTLTLKMRDDITFEDGTPVTAHDVAFTWELIADPNVASPRISFIERMKDDARPRVVDDHTLVYEFTEAYDRDTQIAHASGLTVVPRHELEDADRGRLRGHPLTKAPLATGPWRLASYEPNTAIVLEPNDKFTGPEEDKPHLDRVIFKIIPEYSTRLLELQNGKVDYMQSITVEDADLLRESNPEINLVRRGWRAMDYVGWNLNNPKFQDKQVRTALAHAVDVDGMIGKLLTSDTGEAFARRSVGTVTPALCGVHNDDIRPIQYDPAKAKELLAAAGWTDTDGDGYIDKDGTPFEFTLTTNTGNKRRGDASILLQSYFKDVGIKMNIEKQESNTFFENLRKKDYEAALAGWAAGLFVDPSTIWHSDVTCDGPEAAEGCTPRKYEFNFVSYSNPRADELIERGLRTPKPDESAPIWKELQQVIYDDQPYLFLWWQDEIVGVHERFEDTSINVLSALDNLHEWRVPPEKVKHR